MSDNTFATATKANIQREMIKSDIETYHGNLKLEFSNVARKITAMVGDIKNDPHFSYVRDDLEKAYKVAKATRFKDKEREHRSTYEKLSVAKASAVVNALEKAIDQSKRHGSASLQEKVKTLIPSVDILRNNGKALQSNMNRLHGAEKTAQNISGSASKPPRI